jgi:hypothetical protein
VEPLTPGGRQVARQDEGGHDEAVGVHHGHRYGPVVGQTLLASINIESV